MNFWNVSFDTAEEYKEFIKQHKYIKTDKEEWTKCKNVVAYSENAVNEDTDTIKYFEFVDDKLNFYVEFFEIKTKKWLESYKFKDRDLCWTAFIDNIFYGNPLNINENIEFDDLIEEFDDLIEE